MSVWITYRRILGRGWTSIVFPLTVQVHNFTSQQNMNWESQIISMSSLCIHWYILNTKQIIVRCKLRNRISEFIFGKQSYNSFLKILYLNFKELNIDKWAFSYFKNHFLSVNRFTQLLCKSNAFFSWLVPSVG